MDYLRILSKIFACKMFRFEVDLNGSIFLVKLLKRYYPIVKKLAF